MAKKHVFHGPVDFQKFEAQNVRLQNLFDFPPEPFEGQIIYKSDIKIGAFYDSGEWLFFGFTEGKRQTLIEIDRAVNEDGDTIQHIFPQTVKGLPAVNDDEFVTKAQLPVFVRYGLISGGVIQYSGFGLTYNFSRAVLEISGTCIAEAGQLTLDPADADDPRFDGLGWEKVSEGVATRIKITGDPLPSPPFPQFSLETQVEGIYVSVPALATAPVGIVTENVYLENTEWAVSFAGLGTGNSSSSSNPKTGVLAIEMSVVRNGFKIILDRGSVIDLNTLTDATFGGDLDLKADFGVKQNIDIIFLDGSGNPASNLLPISLNKASLDYQFFAFNLNQFTFSTKLVRYIEIRYRQSGTGSHLGFFIDNLKIQGGVTQPPTGSGEDGEKGWAPVLAVISDGVRRVLQVIDWTGGEGEKPATGLYIGSGGLVPDLASGVDVRGGSGIDGDNGLNGWSPIFAVVADGERRVLQVSDWTGGTGTEPSSGLFVGPTGFVALVSEGVDIRGAQGPAGSGGGGGGTYITDLDTWPVLKFDKNYRYVHEMSGAVTISAQKVSPLPVVGNVNKVYIKASGGVRPVLSEDYEVVWDNWINTAGHWNRLLFEWTPEGKGIVQIENAHLGTANDGTGLTELTISFDANYVTTHIISNSTKILLNSIGAGIGFNTTLYVRADGVNKPFWGSDIVVTYDNYLNVAGVWNRIKLEWRPENKAIAQLINT